VETTRVRAVLKLTVERGCHGPLGCEIGGESLKLQGWLKTIMASAVVHGKGWGGVGGRESHGQTVFDYVRTESDGVDGRPEVRTRRPAIGP